MHTDLRHRLVDEEDGVSLVEILIAIVLLAIIMGAMAQSLTASLFSAQGQEKQVRATALLQQALEEVAGVPWDEAALCEAAALTQFGAASYTYATGTETLVILDDNDATCTQAGGPPIVPFETVIRSDVDYDVETVITWSDDDLDNDASGNDPNSVQDLKHVQVTVTWENRGEARTVVSETFLAPAALEQPLQTQVEHVSGETFTYLDTAAGFTKTDVVLRLFAQVPQSSVNVTWPLRDGTLVTRPMTSPASDGVTWQLLIPNGSPNLGLNELANGETIFEFTATDTATGTPQIVFDRALFLIEQSGHEITSRTYPTTIRLRDDGTACDFSLEIEVRGGLSSDLVAATWTNGPAETALTSTSSDNVGASYRAIFDDVVGFSPGTTDLTVKVERIPDVHDIQDVVTSIPVVQLEDDESC